MHCLTTSDSDCNTDTHSCGSSVLCAGPIPTTIGELISLRVLAARHNQLSGESNTIRQSNGAQLVCMARLQAGDNGEHPSAITAKGGILTLAFAAFGRCVLRAGRVPSEIGRLTSLAFFDVSSNQLTGGSDCVVRTLRTCCHVCV